MSKFIPFLAKIFAFLLFTSCTQKVEKTNMANFNQQKLDWKIESATKTVWDGEKISSTNGSTNPADYKITLEKKGKKKIKLTIDEKNISDATWESMPENILPYNIKLNLPSDYNFVSNERMRNVFQSNPQKNKFGANTTFYINCMKDPNRLNEISFQIYAKSDLIKEYKFESHGFEKAVKFMVCK